MNLLALIIGGAIASCVVVRFRVTKLEKKRLPYPLLLATFPLYYLVFAIYSKDHNALANETLIGLAFVAIAYAAYKMKNKIGIAVLAIGYIGHAVYDVVHNHLFINEGTPVWWPEFCGAVDGLIGVYLVYLVLSMRPHREYT